MKLCSLSQYDCGFYDQAYFLSTFLNTYMLLLINQKSSSSSSFWSLIMSYYGASEQNFLHISHLQGLNTMINVRVTTAIEIFEFCKLLSRNFENWKHFWKSISKDVYTIVNFYLIQSVHSLILTCVVLLTIQSYSEEYHENHPPWYPWSLESPGQIMIGTPH